MNPDDYRCKEYKYATKNVGHVFATKLDEDRLKKIFEERAEYNFTSSGEKSTKEAPYI